MERFFNTAGPNCEEEQSTIHNSAKDELQPQMAWECGLPAYLQHDLNQLFRFPALARHATGTSFGFRPVSFAYTDTGL